MEAPITRVILVVVAIAITVLVTITVQNRVTGTVDEINKQSDVVYNLGDIDSQGLCEAVGATWTASNTVKCAE